MAAARYSPREVVGDLGGMPVTIPSHFANFAEYDGDPGFGERRVGSRPERTHQSKLRSFGFNVRFSDMVGLSDLKAKDDYKRHTIYDTPWIRVSITAGEDFGDGQFLERSVNGMNWRNPRFHFEKQLATQYGLFVYSPSNVAPASRRTGKHHLDDKDWFVHYDAEGRVDALITCSNVNHDAAPCEHYFFLPPPLKAKITVGYRRGLLPKWQQIQSSVTPLILRFKASTAPAAVRAAGLTGFSNGFNV